jgi:hypothetical protein
MDPMDARPGDTSLGLAALLLTASLVVGLQDHLAAAVVLVWGAALLFGYGRWLDTSPPS